MVNYDVLYTLREYINFFTPTVNELKQKKSQVTIDIHCNIPISKFYKLNSALAPHYTLVDISSQGELTYVRMIE